MPPPLLPLVLPQLALSLMTNSVDSFEWPGLPASSDARDFDPLPPTDSRCAPTSDTTRRCSWPLDASISRTILSPAQPCIEGGTKSTTNFPFRIAQQTNTHDENRPCFIDSTPLDRGDTTRSRDFS